MKSTPFFPSLRPCLAPMGSRLRATTARLSQATLEQIELSLAPALDPALLQRPSKGAHSRERAFPLARTFWCWIWQVLQANTSCREVVRQVQALLAILGELQIDEGTGAYCQARAKISTPFLEKAFQSSFRSAQKEAPISTLLQGRHLKVVDASCLRLQDTPKNREDFPPPKSQLPETGFPLLKMLALFSLASGAIQAHAVGSLAVSELRLLMELRPHLKPKDILLGDRAYGLYVIAGWLTDQSVDLIARLSTLSRRVDFRKALRSLGSKDALFVWLKPPKPSALLSPQQWADLPEQITVRILHTSLKKPGFRTRELTLVTTLLDEQLYPAQDIFEAFCKRWRLEMCFDDLKTTLHMEMLGCRSPRMVKMELLVFLITHNLIRWIMGQAATAAQIELERISFKGTLDAFRQWSAALLQIRGPGIRKKKKTLWRQFLEILAADLVPERPGRQEPRAIKRRSKYDFLNKPRHSFVGRLSRNKRRTISIANKKHHCLN